MRALVATVVIVPLAVQALLLAWVAATLLPSAQWPQHTAEAVLALPTVALAAWLGKRFARRGDLPASPWARYGPLLAYPLLIWLAWVVSMHASGGDFTRPPNALFYALMPFLLLSLVAGFEGHLWWLLLVPLGAYAAFVGGFWHASRKQPTQPAASRVWASAVFGALALSLGGVTAWQALERARALAPSDGQALREEVQMHRYRPFAADNLLKPVQPRPGLQFGLADAPALDGATAAYPVYAAAAQAMYSEEAARRRVEVSRTPEAYQRLIDGQADLIFVAQASPAQQQRAADAGVALRFTPVAKEAFVFLVSPDNPVHSLSLAQIRAIYSGQITRWSAVGGPDARIVAYQRPADSGSQTVMLAQVMQGAPMAQPLDEELAVGMGGLVRKVAAYRNAAPSLGYSFRYYATQMKADDPVRLLAVDGVAPTPENIRTGRYPLTVDVFMVTRQNPPPNVQRLMDWFLGDAGQKLVADVGYVPLR
ncbi:MAG: PstS family phosphate ABC transporter substrate-binding protein [Pseudomonadota bacterium]|nr:PstS family phosphate ABC transporter substrate-binding protein [Pseudomonadota bacterium]